MIFMQNRRDESRGLGVLPHTHQRRQRPFANRRSIMFICRQRIVVYGTALDGMEGLLRLGVRRPLIGQVDGHKCMLAHVGVRGAEVLITLAN